jgi:hypothetical protein
MLVAHQDSGFRILFSMNIFYFRKVSEISKNKFDKNLCDDLNLKQLAANADCEESTKVHKRHFQRLYT